MVVPTAPHRLAFLSIPWIRAQSRNRRHWPYSRSVCLAWALSLPEELGPAREMRHRCSSLAIIALSGYKPGREEVAPVRRGLAAGAWRAGFVNSGLALFAGLVGAIIHPTHHESCSGGMRWTFRRKAEIVAALQAGTVTATELELRHGIYSRGAQQRGSPPTTRMDWMA